MTLPFVFANSPATPPLALSSLDSNYNAVGFCTIIPCTVQGTNSITLTPAANTPNPVYGPYAVFSGVAAATNTAAVQAAVGGLTRLSVYKDTNSGPILLTGGEIVSGTYFTLRYDPVLTGGSGGFHLGSANASAALSPISNLSVLANISGVAAVPVGTTVSSVLDAVVGPTGTTQGGILVRGTTYWQGSIETAWVPTIAFGGASVGITYSAQAGRYLSIGFLVIGVYSLTLSNVGSSTGAATLALPVTAGATRPGSLIVSNWGLTAGDTTDIFGSIAAGAATAALFKSGGAGVPTALANTDFTNTSTLSGSFIMFTG